MPIFEQFPYTNMHELNLDYILETQKKQEEAFTDVIEEATELKNETAQLKADTSDLKDETEQLKADTSDLKDETEILTAQARNTVEPFLAKYDQIDNNTANIQRNYLLIAQNTNDISVNSARIDEFTNLPEGSTSGDAELADIRIAQNGLVYPTAGDAVRGQIAELDNMLDVEPVSVFNAMTNPTVLQHAYISDAGLIVLQTDPTNLFIAFYPVKKGNKYNINGEAKLAVNGFTLLAFNKTIPNVTGTEAQTIIQTGTTTLTWYNENYTAEDDGYLLVCGINESLYGALAVFETENVTSAVLTKLNKITNNIKDYDIELTFESAENMYLSNYTANKIIATTGFIIYYVPVKKDKQYRVIYNNYSLYGYYGAIAFAENVPEVGDDVTILKEGSTTAQNIDFSYIPPENGYLLVQKAQKSGSTDVKIMRKANQWDDNSAKTNLRLQVFGDSITDNANNTWEGHTTWLNQIHNVLDNFYNLAIVNSAYGGASLTNRNQYSVVNRLPDLLDANADVITIWAGTNDWAEGVSIGNMSSADTTLKGAVKSIIEYLSEHTTAQIIFATPMQRYNTTDAERDTNANGEPLNSSNNTLAEYAEAIKEVCDFYSIPCVPFYTDLGINRINVHDFCADGLHPSTAKANRRIASLFGAYIRRYNLQ